MNKAIVTGGGGFVGSAIVKLLLGKNIQVAVIGRNRYPHLEQLGVECLQGDISDRSFMEKLLQDADVVFHVAALAGIWGRYDDYYRINVVGTENVIQSCLEAGVKALVYTSTPSVVFDREDIVDGTEELPYAKTFLCGYAQSKAIAEKQVLAVDQGDLSTCAIRPHLVWGVGDPHLLPRLISRGKSGDLKIIGDGTNMVDITYVENAASAHVRAAENLLGSGEASGNAYFIGQEQPVVLWRWINDLFEKLGIPPVTTSVPFSTAYAVGALLEGLHRMLNIHKEPKMTRFLAQQLAKSHYFSHDRARRDFGYRPDIETEEGLAKTLHWLQTQ